MFFKKKKSIFFGNIFEIIFSPIGCTENFLCGQASTSIMHTQYSFVENIL